MKLRLFPERPILVVDDDPRILNTLELALFSEGFTHLALTGSPLQAADLIGRQGFDAVLLDIVMPELSGRELLKKIREQQPDTPVIMVSGVNDLETAVDCMRCGAFDYILKPAGKDQVAAALRRALEIGRLKKENYRLAESLLGTPLKHPEAFAAIVTADDTMRNLFRYCEAVAPGSEPFLITGETGVGKELFARLIHILSGRGGEFFAVNVAGLDEQAFTDTLFGHCKGAFTGADHSRAGFFEKAAAGTLFLDEIGDLSPSCQIKLLRVLEEKRYYPLGADAPKPFAARLVAATHQNLETLRESGRFRADFYYRIATHGVRIPPLRRRPKDIPLLLDHFLRQAAREFGKKVPTYPPELIALLKTHDFPGNVRELRAMVFDAVGSHQGRMLGLEPFEKFLGPKSAAAALKQTATAAANPFAALERLPALKEAARDLIEEALRRSGGNQRLAARLLGITPQALSGRLKRDAE
ncbi:MAG: sigma-54-dependent Fis family transcriptional regulator [Deltaproteobacteria bacterium]|nr:sigma-54-dependent Fis family transcriptional regulator [Deltaproteobacteria bacterium]